jgi:hypothetical protein
MVFGWDPRWNGAQIMPVSWSSGQRPWLQFQRYRVRFPGPTDVMRSSGSGTGSTQLRENNRRATWKKKQGLRCRKPRLKDGGIPCADQATPVYQRKLALTSPRSGGWLVGTVRLGIKGHWVCFLCLTWSTAEGLPKRVRLQWLTVSVVITSGVTGTWGTDVISSSQEQCGSYIRYCSIGWFGFTTFECSYLRWLWWTAADGRYEVGMAIPTISVW